jgi:hypothetical protein
MSSTDGRRTDPMHILQRRIGLTPSQFNFCLLFRQHVVTFSSKEKENRFDDWGRPDLPPLMTTGLAHGMREQQRCYQQVFCESPRTHHAVWEADRPSELSPRLRQDHNQGRTRGLDHPRTSPLTRLAPLRQGRAQKGRQRDSRTLLRTGDQRDLRAPPSRASDRRRRCHDPGSIGLAPSARRRKTGSRHAIPPVPSTRQSK